MHWNRQAFSRFRPRAITFVVLAIVASLVVLANLSEDVYPRDRAASPRGPLLGADLIFDAGGPAANSSSSSNIPDTPWSNISYGWPLAWHQYILVLGPLAGIVGSCYSASRLAANMVVWILIFASAGGACEWLARRYRPQFRWNLRAMLIGIALVALACAWFATARRRAILQDPLIAGSGRFWVERWEPKWPRWLKLVGIDRYCRRIVGAELEDRYGIDLDNETEVVLARLARLPSLEYLSLKTRHLTSGMIAAFGEMRGLRVLSVDMSRQSWRQRDAEDIPRDFLAAIGKISALEHLRLHDVPIVSEDLESLSGLTNLRALHLNGVFVAISRVPALPRLEVLNLHHSRFKNDYLGHLVASPKLKALSLAYTPVTEVGLAQLASLPSLEELLITERRRERAGTRCVAGG